MTGFKRSRRSSDETNLNGGLHELQSAVIVVVTVALALAGCAHVQQQFAALPRCSRMKAGRR